MNTSITNSDLWSSNNYNDYILDNVLLVSAYVYILTLLNTLFRREVEKLELEREEVLKDLRLIESRNNQNKDEKHIEGLGDLGREKSKSLANSVWLVRRLTESHFLRICSDFYYI